MDGVEAPGHVTRRHRGDTINRGGAADKICRGASGLLSRQPQAGAPLARSTWNDLDSTRASNNNGANPRILKHRGGATVDAQD
jgi:hypothetical protein